MNSNVSGTPIKIFICYGNLYYERVITGHFDRLDTLVVLGGAFFCTNLHVATLFQP